ncbi:MAG: AraC family transcriptional regulator [Devosia sp.]
MRQSQLRPIDSSTKPARGLLHRTTSFEHFTLTRFEPSPDLADHVEHHWLILWDLTGQPPYVQHNLSHPTQHLVLNPQERTGIFGLATGRFTYALEHSGRVLGTKFRPGAFHGFYKRPVSELTDTVVPIETAFPRSNDDLVAEFVALNDPLGMAGRIEELLRATLPPPSPRAIKARELVGLIEQSPELVSVAALADMAATTPRSLQRLFDTYVGVGPKWVIDRYRMIEAVEALNRGEAVNLAGLAASLGYFDQAHFANTFRALTGQAPGQYRGA